MMMFRIVVLVALAAVTTASDKQTLRGGGSKDGGSNGGSTEAAATLKNQFTCTTDGLNDQNLCQSATDDSNQSCVWCSSSSGFGLCVSSDQSSLIAQLMPDVECGGGITDIEETKPLEDLYDPACVLAGIQGGDDGESVCGDAQDADGGDCSWCSATDGFGICLNEEQTAIAKQFGGAYLTCADVDDTTIKGATRFYSWDAEHKNEEDSSNSSPIPPDIPECFSHSKEDVCNGASDPSCVWCDTSVGFGLCFSEEMAALARKMFNPMFDCGDAATAAALVLEEAETFMEEEEAIETMVDDEVDVIDATTTTNMEDPLDPSCILAIANAEQSEAEGICKNTTDTDGDGCDWCTLADVYGVCLTPEQADMAAQYLTCDSGRSSSSAIVVQEEEEEEQPAADFEEEVMITKTKAMIKNPYDPACAVAAWQAADAESVCGDSADTEGDACIWCEAPTNNAGVCLNHEQAEIASQWLSCNLLAAADDEVVAAQE
eukprot:CAMPEP_0194033688 /NCGR_PEP_ID=MMETSP0009_2-20130614/6273_1 /TAXON_ID=210454 /ORGANISM="Grammatophora oceanica, Strain CCMP 410" /LENGTH=488 /DNA_ID=CAMNT_0038674405 /DNA_START=51 /DNA_END=1517 /DNA_ORIENTATION=+